MRLLLLLPLLAASAPAQSPAILAALATGTYFPLDTGNRWVYRIDSRVLTAGYQIWRIDRTQNFGGKTYSVMSIESADGVLGESWFRAGDDGRVYILTGAGEQLFLDPTVAPNPAAQLAVTGRSQTVTGSLGTFPDGIAYLNPSTGGFEDETGTLIRGVGLMASTSVLHAGSSGGFTYGRTLIEASLAGGIHLALAAPAIQLGVESLSLDVTNKLAPNCAVPCYFVACSLAPGADPAGTYKPCARARVSLANWPAGTNRFVDVQLLSADGAVVFDRKLAMDAAPGEAVNFLQVPLYSTPNQPFPAGTYKLVATTADAAAQSSLTIQLQ